MSGHERYINRESSWLEFNRRVLSEAANHHHPILERLKFLAIFESNLDEFFMIRVSGLMEQEMSGSKARSPDGMTAAQQVKMVIETSNALRKEAGRVWIEDLAPNLAQHGIEILPWADLTSDQKDDLKSKFESIFTLLTPVMFRPGQSFPHISNRSLNIGFVLLADGERKFGRIKVPTIVPRLIPIKSRSDSFVLIEDLIIAFAEEIFVDVEIESNFLYRVVRDADFEIKELEAGDLFGIVEETMFKRRFGDPVCLEVEAGADLEAVEVIRQGLELYESDVRSVSRPLGMDFCWELASLPRPSLLFSRHTPYVDPHLATCNDIFLTIREADVLIHHPYDTFATVEQFVASAATDPNVLGIKQTLYRVGAESPIVESLMQAAHAGKAVAVIVELKARFDETNNLNWAKALEHAGAHVSYGVPDLKVHSKLCMINRRESDEIRTYVHIGTGNYNPTTARLYTDIGYFTCKKDITQDVAELFNFLTGLSKQSKYRKILVAPFSLREQIVERIERETENLKAGKPARIAFKVNSLVDPEIVDALYEASQAGVPIDLIVRGTCCLRPGVPGMSENITVHSIVGRFLEHSRVYWFANGDEPEALIGSADMMRRNLDRRTEVLVPLRDPAHVSYLHSCVIEPALRDTLQGWVLESDGNYRRLHHPRGKSGFSSQDFLMAARGLDCETQDD